MNIYEVLKKVYGYDSFREAQEELILSVLMGFDVLGIMPTGAGKSICYQIPAQLMDGTTIVISPLISLMQDQVTDLNDKGIRAAYINSSMNEQEVYEVYKTAERGEYTLLYVAPERIDTSSFKRLQERIKIPMVAVDEAHCVSQWGQDFRPSYLKIAEFVNTLPARPIVCAFTATATERVKQDIIKMLKLENPVLKTTSFDRKNLYFNVYRDEDKDSFILNYITAHFSESGIIYCSTKKAVDAVCEMLTKNGIKAAAYHSEIDNKEKQLAQTDFIYDRIQVMVATNAFGMGIDKPNVRFVIHYNMPMCMENYYQEAGRAGRDGSKAECILLYSDKDVATCRFLLSRKNLSELSPEEANEVRDKDSQRLDSMVKYCHTRSCLRQYILNYFGEKALSVCKNCGPCLVRTVKTHRKKNVTKEARMIVLCLQEYNGKVSNEILGGTLLGNESQKLKAIGAYNLETYGALDNISSSDYLRILTTLLDEGVLRFEHKPTPVIAVADISKVQSSSWAIFINADDNVVPVKKPSRDKSQRKTAETDDEKTLLSMLKEQRLAIARSMGVPPYIVFHDNILEEMSVKQPVTRRDMLNISGVSSEKFRKYGNMFIGTIVSHKREAARLNNSSSRTHTKSEPLAGPGQSNASSGPASSESSIYWTKRDEKALLNKLKELRKAIANDEGYPVQNIFFNKTLEEMASKRPDSPEKMIEIIGVGEYKLQKYGERFINVIIDYNRSLASQKRTGSPKTISNTNAKVKPKKKTTRASAGSPWSKVEDEILMSEYRAGLPIKEIAKIHERTSGAIRARLKKHGVQ